MIERLETLDRELLLAINGGHPVWLDDLMLLVSEKLTWVPLYVIALYYLWKVLGTTNWLWSLLFIGAMMALADAGSVKLFKEVFQRYRPCHNLDIQHLVHLADGHCGGRFGFISSHATNHFAIAVFLATTVGRRWKWTRYALIVWALLVAYSRVHLGVHYPSDVLFGALYGTAVAVFISFLLDRLLLRRNLKP